MFCPWVMCILTIWVYSAFEFILHCTKRCCFFAILHPYISSCWLVVNNHGILLCNILAGTYLQSTMKLRHGNIFTGICQSFCSQDVCVCPSMLLTRHHPPRHDTPWADTPLGRQGAHTGKLSTVLLKLKLWDSRPLVVKVVA